MSRQAPQQERSATAPPAPESKAFGLLQRQCSCGAKATSGGSCPSCRREEEKRLLQRRTVETPAVTSPLAPPIVHEVLRTPGAPLDAPTRAYFEPRFHHDFSQVRVHDDDRAAESARSVQARAYTVGSHVVFNRGEYRPDTPEGRRTLAHELTHVVQQPEGSAVQPSLIVGPQDSAPEREADRAAEAVVAGGEATVTQRTSAGTLGRQACFDLIQAQQRADVKGIDVHRAIGAQFRDRFGTSAIGLKIPGAKNTYTDKCGARDKSMIAPEVMDEVDDPRSQLNVGIPDLIYKQGGRTAQSDAELAEIKPADCFHEAEVQVARYRDQGNMSDARMVNYRKKRKITNFKLMDAMRFTPASPTMVGSEPVTVRWCGDGVIGYKAIRDQDPEVFVCEAVSDKGKVDRFLDRTLGRAQQKIDEYLNSVLDPLLSKAINGLTLRKAVGMLYRAAKGELLEQAGLSAEALKGMDDEAIVDKIAQALDSQLNGAALANIKTILMAVKEKFLSMLRQKLQDTLRNALQEGLNALCATATVLTADMIAKWYRDNFKKFLDAAIPEVVMALVKLMLIEMAKGALLGLAVAVAFVAFILLLPEEGIVAGIVALAEALAVAVRAAIPLLLRLIPRLVFAGASDQSVEKDDGTAIAANTPAEPTPAAPPAPAAETPAPAVA